METFGLLASRFPCSRYLAPAFSLLASVRARCLSLVMVKAGRPDPPRVLGTLPRHKRQLAIVVLLRLVIVLTARDHHVSGRGEFTLEAIRTKRKRLIEVVISGASEVHLHRTEVDDRFVLAECREPKETREVAISDCWSGDRSRRNRLAVPVFQGDGQLAIERGRL